MTAVVDPLLTLAGFEIPQRSKPLTWSLPIRYAVTDSFGYCSGRVCNWVN
jgi:hypothetical protein